MDHPAAPGDPLPTPSDAADAPTDEPLSPRVVLLWRLGWWIATAVLLVPVMLLVLAGGGDEGLPTAAVIGAPLLLIAAGVGLSIVIPNATYRHWRYAITPDGVELRHGVLRRQQTSIPHFRVQHIDIQQGPLDRWRGIVTMQIATASPHTDAQLPGIEPERAEVLRARILERAEADDGV